MVINQGEPRVYHFLSDAGFLQKWRIIWQIMVIVDTPNKHTKQTRPQSTSSVRRVVPPRSNTKLIAGSARSSTTGHYTIPYHTIPYHIIPCYTIILSTISYYTSLPNTILYRTVLQYTIHYRHANDNDIANLEDLESPYASELGP